MQAGVAGETGKLAGLEGSRQAEQARRRGANRLAASDRPESIIAIFQDVSLFGEISGLEETLSD